jgi:GT2 family glycosyltransferase
MEKVMVSVVSVNYNSSALLKDCYHSIPAAVGNVPFEFFAIDSGSRAEEVDSLSGLRGSNVVIIAEKDNIGYARAVNIGIRNAKGNYILITNPDVVYRPGCIKAMVDAVTELPRCGAVGPKTWWNKKMTFLLPMSELITPYWLFKTEFMRASRTLNDIFLKGVARKSSEYWASKEPVMQEMLPGACIMTTRQVIGKVGGFDEAFTLYFEDTDWCLRARNAGYRLYMEPRANIIHYYNQSARQERSISQKKFNDSLEKYLRKNFRLSSIVFRRMQRLLMSAGNKTTTIYDDMGTLDAPPVFAFKDSSKKLLLLSPIDSLMPSAGSFIEGLSFGIPQDLWELMGEGRYFLRALEAGSLEDRGAWCWTKLGRKRP